MIKLALAAILAAFTITTATAHVPTGYHVRMCPTFWADAGRFVSTCGNWKLNVVSTRNPQATVNTHGE